MVLKSREEKLMDYCRDQNTVPANGKKEPWRQPIANKAYKSPGNDSWPMQAESGFIAAG
jgi:hypothetical protein